MNGSVAVSIVVASHGRHLRLRWLLNALAEQEMEEPWELVVVHDYDAATAARVIDGHPLARARRLSHFAIEPGTGSPARQRNIGWRAARGELVAFTDDDCRPSPRWLAALVAAARRHPGQIVQGTTRPDPLEAAVGEGPHVRTLHIDPVGPFAQTCNILYPRELIEQLGGFDEDAVTGEDVDLSLRARASGRSVVAAPDALVHHAVESHTLPGIVRQNLKWRHLAYLVSRHPELRDDLRWRIFWDGHHLRASAALAGLLAARVHPVALVLALPFVRYGARRRGTAPARRALAVAELPGQAVRQFAEVIGLAVGSVRHRTPLL